MKHFSTTHTRTTKNPQSYWQHLRVALFGSLRLIALGLGGIFHAFFPEYRRLQFWTSTGVIRIYRELEMSGRHDDEIAESKFALALGQGKILKSQYDD